MCGYQDREKEFQEKEKRRIYNEAYANAVFESINLYNVNKGKNAKSKTFPSYDDFYENEKENDKTVYEKVTSKNAYEFLIKNKKALENAKK